jgi:tetratricopeptide (TPR) repeat protein
VLRRAIELAGRIGATRELAEATMDLAIVLSYQGRAEAAVVMIQEAYALAMEVGNPISLGLGRIYNNYAAIAGGADLRRSLEVLREGLEMTRKAGATQYVAWITGTLGDIQKELGDLEEAEALTRDSITLARSIGDDPLLGMRLTGLGDVLVLRGRTDEAEEAFRASGRILEENPEPQSEALHALLRARIARARDDRSGELDALQAGARWLSEATAIADAELLPELARRALELGDRALAERIRAIVGDGWSFPIGRAASRNIDGLLAEDPAERVGRLAEAVALFEEVGLRVRTAQALIDLGRARARMGEDARPTLARARELLVACDAQLFLLDVDAALAELGPTT